MMFGLACFAVSMWNFTPITHEWGWRELLLPQALRGFSQQFAVAPTVTLTLGGLATGAAEAGIGMFNLMRNLGGAIGIAVCGTILNDRTNLHFLRLAEHLNSSNPAMLRYLEGDGGARDHGARRRCVTRPRCGAAGTVVTHAARGADASLRGCVLCHRVVLCLGSRDGAADAQDRDADNAVAGRSLK